MNYHRWVRRLGLAAGGIALALLLYIPSWLLTGMIEYPHTHPDFWPNQVIIVACSISIAVSSAVMFAVGKRKREQA